jgi:branched-chain amino acid transport system ATP-binding protein
VDAAAEARSWGGNGDRQAKEPLLRAEGVVKRFGGLAAVDGLSFSVQPGEILGLIGPNGAGKTTMFNCLAGSDRPSAGRIWFKGEAIEALPAHARALRGLRRTFQIPKPFGTMSIVENVMLAATGQRGEHILPNWLRPGAVRRQEAEIHERAMALLDFVSLARLAREPARVLSGGQRKLLELARVLMGDPAMLLLDEPAAGVNPALLELIIDRITAIKARGVTILLIEHNMDMVARLCSYVVVMAQGRLLAEGTPAAVVADPAVMEAYLGEAA